METLTSIVHSSPTVLFIPRYNTVVNAWMFKTLTLGWIPIHTGLVSRIMRGYNLKCVSNPSHKFVWSLLHFAPFDHISSLRVKHTLYDWLGCVLIRNEEERDLKPFERSTKCLKMVPQFVCIL